MSIRGMRIVFTSEMISAMIAFRNEGYTVTDLADAIGISIGTFLKWRRINKITLAPLFRPAKGRIYYPLSHGTE